MATFIKSFMSRVTADAFMRDLESGENKYFFFIAKATPWTNDASPESFIDSDDGERGVCRNIIGYKKINPANVIPCIPRYDWTAGRIYDEYDDVIDLFGAVAPKIFYVLTNQRHIYKCLNNGGGVPSTVRPNLVLDNSFKTSDGYVWKYLATVRETDYTTNFTDHIPVDYITTTEDNETINQYNVQVQAKIGSIIKIIKTFAGNAIYPNTMVSPAVGEGGLYISGFTAGVVAGTSTVTITNPNSLALFEQIQTSAIGYNSNNTFAGYVLKIKRNPNNITQINNYAIITNTALTDSTTLTITLKNDVVNFVVTPPTGNQLPVTADIIPFVKITGDGDGAYCFPIMSNISTITDIEVGSGGQNYTHASLNITNPTQNNSAPPQFRIVFSPKEGHGSNILKELNAKKILIVVSLSLEDEEEIMVGGSYRQFGIIKNPKLFSSGELAGVLDRTYRDIVFLNTTTTATKTLSDSLFSPTSSDVVIGTETFSSVKSYGVNSINSTSKRIVLKTGNSSDSFSTIESRPNDYILSLSSVGPVFKIGEIVSQHIPANTTFSVSGAASVSGISYSYAVLAKGIVVDASEFIPGGKTLGVRVTHNAFVVSPSVGITGSVSGATGTVSVISPRYGEYVHTARLTGGLTFTSESKLKVVSVGVPYIDGVVGSKYSGLYKLHISSSVGGSTGGLDTTYTPLTPTSFAYGEYIQQGSTGEWDSNYASGVVYSWKFVNSSSGILSLTDVHGIFKNVSQNGITGSNILGYIVSGVSLPDITPNSGEILYIDNVRPIVRVTGQEEKFRLTVRF